MTQTSIAVAIVAVAALWLARRMYLTLAAAVSGNIDNLGNCGSCSRNRANHQPAVIELAISKSRPPKNESR
jgi:hypothetical protein